MEKELAMLECFVKEEGKPVQSFRKLDDLPGEILSMISGHLTNKQLREFRRIGSRYITQQIDHTFVNAIQPQFNIPIR